MSSTCTYSTETTEEKSLPAHTNAKTGADALAITDKNMDASKTTSEITDANVYVNTDTDADADKNADNTPTYKHRALRTLW